MDCELKRKKARITAQDEGDEEQDRISRLSDDLIHIIMSFLDIQLAVQTCILSKRWKLVWTTLPFLKFRSYDYNSPKSSLPQTKPKFVGKFLKHRNKLSQVSSMKLMLLTPGLFSRYVRYAISHRVQYLNVHICKGPYNLTMFNSNSIQKLKLKMKLPDVVSDSDCWDLPALTTLHLTRLRYDHTHNLPELCLTCLPALTTLCLTDWDLGKWSFSFNLPCLTTLRLTNCKLFEEDWNFPALKSLALLDVVFCKHMRDIFAALVSLQNLTLFFHKNSKCNCYISCPRLVNLEIRTRYHHKNGIHTGYINVSSPKLRNFTSVGIFSITFNKPRLDNVHVKLKGWIDHMILPREMLQKYYERLRSMLWSFGSAKNLYLGLETIEALSSITNYLACSPSPFRKLKYVKLPLGCKEADICCTLRSYLLGGSPTATIVTPWPQNTMIPHTAAASVTAQNVVLEEPLAAPTEVLVDSERSNEIVGVDTVDMGVQEGHAVQNSEVHDDRVIRHVGGRVEGTSNKLVSSSEGKIDIGLWLGHEVKAKFVGLLDHIMNKYPETFKHFATKNKELCTMKLNMLCTTVNNFTKIYITEVDTGMISEYRDVFAGLQNFGFNISWLVSRLNDVEQLLFSEPLLPELHAIDRHIADTKSELQDLQFRVDETKSKLQNLQTLRAEKMQDIQKAFGNMGAVGGYIGDDLLPGP